MYRPIKPGQQKQETERISETSSFEYRSKKHCYRLHGRALHFHADARARYAFHQIAHPSQYVHDNLSTAQTEGL